MPDKNIQAVVALPTITGVHEWLEIATSYEVESAELLEAATLDRRAIKTRWSEIEAMRVELLKPFDSGRRQLQEFFRRPLGVLEQAEGTLEASCLRYRQAEEHKRREREAKLREEARRERERLEAEAKAAEAKGEGEVAEAKREQAQDVPMPVVASTVPKVEGMHTRTDWKVEVQDKAALLRAIIAGKAPIDLVDVNMTVARRYAVSQKQAFNYPGLVAKPVESLPVRKK